MASAVGLEVYHNVGETEVSVLFQLSQDASLEENLALTDTIKFGAQAQILHHKFSCLPTVHVTLSDKNDTVIPGGIKTIKTPWEYTNNDVPWRKCLASRSHSADGSPGKELGRGNPVDRCGCLREHHCI